jgi:hypothetical protein
MRALCARIIAGEVDVIEGSLRMLTFQQWLHAWKDSDFEVFRSVYSASAHLPVGKARAHWHPEALKIKDAEIAALEERYRTRVCRAATRIRESYA